MKIQAAEVARILNEMTRLIPRPDGSLPLHWEELTDEQRNSAIEAVKDITNHDALFFELLDWEPYLFHDVWVKGNEHDGWVYGETYCPINKTHPCMVAFDELPDSEKFKDEIWATVMRMYTPYITWED